jgi:ECF sigma factor
VIPPKLMPLLYAELRRLAKHYMARERPGRTLQTPASRAGKRGVPQAGRFHAHELAHRAHFFAVSAQLMRRILVDFARARGSLKRGAKRPPFRSMKPRSYLTSPART